MQPKHLLEKAAGAVLAREQVGLVQARDPVQVLARVQVLELAQGLAQLLELVQRRPV
jgi:hypothetical protein